MGLAPAEPLDQPDDPVGYSILLPKKSKDMFRGFSLDHSSFPVDPRTFDGTSRVAGCNTNSWIVAYALYLSSARISANKQFSVLFDEPNRRADGVSSFPVCFDADMFLARELRQLVFCGTQWRLFHD